MVYRFEATRISGATNDAWLDHAFIYIRAETAAPDQGAYGTAPTDIDQTTAHLALRTPDLYVDSRRNKPQTIRWDSFGNATDGPVKIDLLADSPAGPQLVTSLAAAAPDNGSFTWTPANFGINYGTHNLRIEISLVANAAVFDRGQETFAVPENTNTFYVNDGNTVGDDDTSAPGNNRNTGKLPSAPKPYPNNILRAYSLAAGQTLYVDTGDYSLFDPLVLSGTAGIGDDEGFTLTGPTNAAHVATLRHALPAQSPPLIDLNDADLMTIRISPWPMPATACLLITAASIWPRPTDNHRQHPRRRPSRHRQHRDVARSFGHQRQQPIWHVYRRAARRANK